MSGLEQQGWKEFLELCFNTKDSKRLAALFDLFLTIDEKESLATRLLIVKGLLAGEKTQRELAEELKVSIAKITRGSNSLKQLSAGLLKYLAESLKTK